MAHLKVPKDLIDQCTPEQYSALVKLYERLLTAESAMRMAKEKEAADKAAAEHQSAMKERKKSLKNLEISTVSMLRSKFEKGNNRSSKVLSIVSKAFKFGRGERPPPRPMTLARNPRQAGSGGG